MLKALILFHLRLSEGLVGTFSVDGALDGTRLMLENICALGLGGASLLSVGIATSSRIGGPWRKFVLKGLRWSSASLSSSSGKKFLLPDPGERKMLDESGRVCALRRLRFMLRSGWENVASDWFASVTLAKELVWIDSRSGTEYLFRFCRSNVPYPGGWSSVPWVGIGGTGELRLVGEVAAGEGTAGGAREVVR